MTFLAGLAAALLVLGVVGGASHAVRAGILPGRTGADARLAEVIIGLTLLLATAQILGTFGLFRPVPVLVGELVVGGVAWAIGSRLQRRTPDDVPATPDLDDRATPLVVERVLALVGTVVVAVQWMTHTGDALGRGMTHADTLWYHLPFAARFVQYGNFNDLAGIGHRAARSFPLNSQLVHALGILTFRSDSLSPYLNLAWAALALLAAWCIGQRHGRGPLALLAAVAVIGAPALAGSQPGQGSSDIACVALVIAAVALLLEADDLEPAPIALAGLATGLAISTKVTIAIPIGVLAIGTLLIILFARRFRLAALWVASVAATGAFWFLRNWAETGSPLPWFDIKVGPLDMPATAAEGGDTLGATLFEDDLWSDVYLPGLSQGLSRLWPLVLGLALVGAVLALVRGRRFERLVGVVVLVGVVGYAYTPLSGGLSFVYTLRYLGPALLVGFMLLVRFCPGGRNGRLVLSVLLGAVVVANALSAHKERVDAWPTGPLLPLLVIALVIAVLVAAYLRLRTREKRWLPAVAAVVAIALIVFGASLSRRHYLDHRYVDDGLNVDAVHEYFRGVENARVAVLGTDETYPMFGPDSSNRTISINRNAYPKEEACRGWRRTFGGRFDYIVITTFGFGYNDHPKPAPWVVAQDDAATEVAREVNREGETFVYELDGPLDPDDCPDDY